MNRPARSEDSRALLRIDGAALPDRPWTRDLFAHYVKEPETYFIVTLDADRNVVGFLLAERKGVVNVSKLAVDPQSRRHGFGKALLEGAILQARMDRASAVTLGTRLDNPAMRLFESLGFTETHRSGGVVAMRLSLTASG